MDKIREFVKNRQASVYRALELDRKYVNDVYNGQFMRGRVAVEEHYLSDLDKLIELIKECEND